MYSEKFYIHTFLQIDKYNNDIDMNRAKLIYVVIK